MAQSIISEDVPLLEFMYVVFTRMPGAVTVGGVGLCCCVPCLSSAIMSLSLFIGSVDRPMNVNSYQDWIISHDGFFSKSAKVNSGSDFERRQQLQQTEPLKTEETTIQTSTHNSEKK